MREGAPLVWLQSPVEHLPTWWRGQEIIMHETTKLIPEHVGGFRITRDADLVADEYDKSARVAVRPPAVRRLVGEPQAMPARLPRGERSQSTYRR